MIADSLNTRSVITPTTYYKLTHPECPQDGASALWTETTVSDILKNVFYKGTLITNCWTTKSYKDDRKIKRPKSEWCTFENRHEALIDLETFELVQKIREGRRKPTRMGDTGVVNGLLRCSDCGAKLHIKRRTDDVREYYICSNYRSGSKTGVCTTHTIRRDNIEALVKADIQRVINYVLANEKSFAEAVRRASKSEAEREVKKAKSDFSKVKSRIKALDGIIKRIYEDNISGKLSNERFATMLSDYEAAQAELRRQADELRAEIDKADNEKLNTDRFIKLVKAHTHIEELTFELVREFIDRIEVGQTHKVDGRTIQEIIIIYNYIKTFPAECKEE